MLFFLLGCQLIVKGRNSGIARWKRRVGPGAEAGVWDFHAVSACHSPASPCVHQLDAPRTPPLGCCGFPHKQDWQITGRRWLMEPPSPPGVSLHHMLLLLVGFFSFSRDHWHSRHGRHEDCLPGHRWPPPPSPCSCVGCCYYTVYVITT